jgi:GNAT superfamily N-acetyltransferase
MKKSGLPTNVNIPRNLSDIQFRYARHSYNTVNTHTLAAVKPDGDRIGSIAWGGRTGEVFSVSTAHEYRGLGIATTLWEKANKLASDTGIASPKHSKGRTRKGDAWAHAVGGKVPPLKGGKHINDLG